MKVVVVVAWKSLPTQQPLGRLPHVVVVFAVVVVVFARRDYRRRRRRARHVRENGPEVEHLRLELHHLGRHHHVRDTARRRPQRRLGLAGGVTQRQQRPNQRRSRIARGGDHAVVVLLLRAPSAACAFAAAPFLLPQAPRQRRNRPRPWSRPSALGRRDRSLPPPKRRYRERRGCFGRRRQRSVVSVSAAVALFALFAVVALFSGDPSSCCFFRFPVSSMPAPAATSL